MQLSVEILDHIFSFLVSHYTLFACSKDPVLSPIVDRHLYSHITVHFRNYCNRWDSSVRFSELVSENPRILSYVRVLRILVSLDHYPEDNDLGIKKDLDEFAQTLLKFPVLECIMLDTSKKRLFCWPDVFRAALEDRLSLPTVKRLHILGNQEFPCSLIDNRKNIEQLFLRGRFIGPEAPICNSTLPQLKSLILFNSVNIDLLPAFHIKELRSLEWASFSVKNFSGLLEVCSETLNKLDIDLDYSVYYPGCSYLEYVDKPLLELSPIPANLQQLTLRAAVYVESTRVSTGNKSYLPATADIVNMFVSSLQHLILDIDIDIDISRIYSNLAKIDFSPLAVLGVAALSIPCIELYVHTDVLPSNITLAQLLFSLEDCEGITRSIEEGTLVIHPEKRFPREVPGSIFAHSDTSFCSFK